MKNIFLIILVITVFGETKLNTMEKCEKCEDYYRQYSDEALRKEIDQLKKLDLGFIAVQFRSLIEAVTDAQREGRLQDVTKEEISQLKGKRDLFKTADQIIKERTLKKSARRRRAKSHASKSTMLYSTSFTTLYQEYTANLTVESKLKLDDKLAMIQDTFQGYLDSPKETFLESMHPNILQNINFTLSEIASAQKEGFLRHITTKEIKKLKHLRKKIENRDQLIKKD